MDELIQKFREISADKIVQRLADLLLEWKTNDSTAKELRDDVERFIGNSWIKNAADHAMAYELWSAFRDDVIGTICGMTMNERLAYFGLFDRFDACQSDDEKRAVYTKLHAAPYLTQPGH